MVNHFLNKKQERDSQRIQVFIINEKKQCLETKTDGMSLFYTIFDALENMLQNQTAACFQWDVFPSYSHHNLGFT